MGWEIFGSGHACGGWDLMGFDGLCDIPKAI